MMSHEDYAVKKFWGRPEFVEKLLPYLDLASIKHLAGFHQLTRNILKKAFIWKKLVKRTFPEDEDVDPDDYITWMIPGYWQDDATLSSEKLKTGLLAGILSLTQDSPGSQLEMVLLHSISDKYLSMKHDEWSNFVEVSCSCLQTHPVAPWGFMLLEEVQATLGFRKQYVLDIDRINGTLDSPLSTALSSMVIRQQGVVTSLEVGRFFCSTKEDAKAIATLVEQSLTMTVKHRAEIEILISEGTGCFNERVLKFGPEGWSAIRRAVEHMSNVHGEDVSLSSERKVMIAGERKDLYAIERAISSWFIRSSGHGTRFEKRYGRLVRHDDEWGEGPRLEDVMEMSDKDWMRFFWYNGHDSESEGEEQDFEEEDSEDEESKREKQDSESVREDQDSAEENQEDGESERETQDSEPKGEEQDSEQEHREDEESEQEKQDSESEREDQDSAEENQEVSESEQEKLDPESEGENLDPESEGEKLDPESEGEEHDSEQENQEYHGEENDSESERKEE